MNDEGAVHAAMTADQIRSLATAVASELKMANESPEKLTGSGGGSRHRGLPEALRNKFIAVRTELFRRGLYDPVLVRFDTATVAQAPIAEVAERLEQVAAAI
jgi:hypothetical protein